MWQRPNPDRLHSLCDEEIYCVEIAMTYGEMHISQRQLAQIVSRVLKLNKKSWLNRTMLKHLSYGTPVMFNMDNDDSFYLYTCRFRITSSPLNKESRKGETFPAYYFCYALSYQIMSFLT